ncbi:MAG: hypothetical protein ABSB88_15965 [Bryobacteraceae bacterium]
MVQLRLDPQGRLLTFHAVPPQVEPPAAAPSTGGKTPALPVGPGGA